MAGESSAISAPTPAPAPPASLTTKKMIADRAATAATNSRPRSCLVRPQEFPLAACNQSPLAAVPHQPPSPPYPLLYVRIAAMPVNTFKLQ